MERTEEGDGTFDRRQLGAAGGGEKLGCSLRGADRRYDLAISLPHGNRGSHLRPRRPGHGSGPDGERVGLESGTGAVFPPGPQGTQQIENTGEQPPVFLAMSTMHEPNVIVYPDSGKVGVVAGEAPGGKSDERLLDAYFDRDDAVDYWDDEG